LKKSKNRFIYGNGHTGDRIADALAKIEVNSKLLNKKITY